MAFDCRVGDDPTLEKPSEDRIEEETEDVDGGAETGELHNDNDDKNALVLAARYTIHFHFPMHLQNPPIYAPINAHSIVLIP